MSSQAGFWQRDSNQVLDFHGNPVNPQFCLLSDGNHHMALHEAMAAFAESELNLSSLFYVTLPPPALRQILQAKSVSLANLQFPVSPNMLISPSSVLEQLHHSGFCRSPQAFVSVKGYAWLVAKSNPKQFSCIDDLARDDVRLFLSNPQTEKVSYQSYRAALKSMCSNRSISSASMAEKIDLGQGIQFGECIHHREAPESIAQGLADVSLLYYHLALRFARIFPQQLELLMTPELEELNNKLVPNEHQLKFALVDDGGTWGDSAATFLNSQKVADIYRYHGLRA